MRSIVDDYSQNLIASRLSFKAADQKLFEQNIHESLTNAFIQKN